MVTNNVTAYKCFLLLYHGYKSCIRGNIWKEINNAHETLTRKKKSTMYWHKVSGNCRSDGGGGRGAFFCWIIGTKELISKLLQLVLVALPCHCCCHLWGISDCCPWLTHNTVVQVWQPVQKCIPVLWLKKKKSNKHRAHHSVAKIQIILYCSVFSPR